MSNYIVYEIWNPITIEPIYVGISDIFQRRGLYRPMDHISEAKRYMNKPLPEKCNKLKIRIIQKILQLGQEPEVRIVYETDNRDDVFAKEIELIRSYGRRDLGHGPLTNLTDGGEGAFGAIKTDEMRRHLSELFSGDRNPNYNNKWTEAKKRELSDRLKGRPGHAGSENQRHAVSKSNSERIWTDDMRDRMREVKTGQANLKLRGRNLTGDHRQKIAKARMDQTKYKWKHDEHGEFEGTRSALIEMFPDHDIRRGELTKLIKGTYKSHRGWTIIE